MFVCVEDVFGKGEYEQDKISAYQTLYTCMLTAAKLSAPVAPFFMDRLYKDLTSVTGKETFDSVHLADFPVYDAAFVDASLERKMENAQIISSLVLSLRAKEKNQSSSTITENNDSCIGRSTKRRNFSRFSVN